ncbi:MAG TPA: hypothetical protein VF516_46275 [Kofleriaceae bacterium]
MAKSLFLFILNVAIIAVPTAVLAQSTPPRCSTDALDPDLAVQRLEWARMCGLTRNTGGVNSAFDSTAAFDLMFNPAKEYREIDPNHAFSGNTEDYNVNLNYSLARYTATPTYTVTQESTGLTTGYWKWSHTTQRAQPKYPTFETSPVAGSGTQLIPLPSFFNDCNLYVWDRTAGTLTPWTGSFYVVAYCPST